MEEYKKSLVFVQSIHKPCNLFMANKKQEKLDVEYYIYGCTQIVHITKIDLIQWRSSASILQWGYKKKWQQSFISTTKAKSRMIIVFGLVVIFYVKFLSSKSLAYVYWVDSMEISLAIDTFQLESGLKSLRCWFSDWLWYLFALWLLVLNEVTRVQSNRRNEYGENTNCERENKYFSIDHFGIVLVECFIDDARTCIIACIQLIDHWQWANPQWMPYFNDTAGQQQNARKIKI